MNDLSDDEREWVGNAAERIKAKDLPKGLTKREYLTKLVKDSEGICAYSGIKMSFKKEDRCPGGGKRGHPFFASLDHFSPGHDKFGHRIVCNDINNLKSKLPMRCFLDLQKTKSWIELMDKLNKQSLKDYNSIESIVNIIREFDSNPSE